MPSNRWAVHHPIVVGLRGAINTHYLAYAWPREVDEIAAEAWERMTYGGVGVCLPGTKGNIFGIFNITVEPELPDVTC